MSYGSCRPIILKRAARRAPTARELLNRFNWLDAGEVAARVEAVLALHKHRPNTTWPTLVGHCDHCVTDWPCPTVRLLDGEQP